MGSEIVLSDVITDIAAGPFGSNLKVSCFVPSGFPIIDGANLKGFKVTDNLTKFVTEEKARSLSRSIAKRGDVVVTISGTLGQISYIPEDSAYEEYLCSQRQFKVTFDTSKVYVPYLVFYFHTREGRGKLLAFANQTGVPALAQPTKNFKRITLELPELEQQRKIALIAELLTAKIEANAKLNGYLEEIGKAIWRKAIETSGTSACIGDIAAEIVTGKTPSTKVPEYYGDKYPFITIPDMHSNVWLCSTERRLSETGNRAQPKKLVPRGAVLVSCIATLGLVGIVQKPSHFNQQINAVVPASEGDEFFLYYAMRSMTQALLGIGATGSATLNVNKSAFSQIEIPWLEGKAMVGFVQTVRPIFETIEVNSIESLRLRKLSDSLLPKLMSGEIDVSKVMF